MEFHLGHRRDDTTFAVVPVWLILVVRSAVERITGESARFYPYTAVRKNLAPMSYDEVMQKAGQVYKYDDGYVPECTILETHYDQDAIAAGVKAFMDLPESEQLEDPDYCPKRDSFDDGDDQSPEPIFPDTPEAEAAWDNLVAIAEAEAGDVPAIVTPTLRFKMRPRSSEPDRSQGDRKSYHVQTPFTVGSWGWPRGSANMSPQELYARRLLRAACNGDDLDSVPLPTPAAELRHAARAKLDAALNVLLAFEPIGYTEWDGADEGDYLAQALFLCACVPLTAGVDDMYAPMEVAMNRTIGEPPYPRRGIISSRPIGPAMHYDGESDMADVPEDLRPSVYAHEVVMAAHMLSGLWGAAGIRQIEESGLVAMGEARDMYFSDCSAEDWRDRSDWLVRTARSLAFTPEYAVSFGTFFFDYSSGDGSVYREQFAEWVEPDGIVDAPYDDSEIEGEDRSDTSADLGELLAECFGDSANDSAGDMGDTRPVAGAPDSTGDGTE